MKKKNKIKRSFLPAFIFLFLPVFYGSLDAFDIKKSDTSFPLKHAGLRWSEKAPKRMNWKDAKTYCKDLGGRLPTISELRTLIKNCPVTETGGSCGVTDSCLISDCWNDACSGCSLDKSGKYSVFRETVWLWSSSGISGNTHDAWFVLFKGGNVSNAPRYNKNDVRCVQ